MSEMCVIYVGSWARTDKDNFTLIKFYWNQTYDCTVSVQHVPGLRLHSAHIQTAPLRKRIMFRVSQIPRHNRHQDAMDTTLSSSEEYSTHIYSRPQSKE
jgi:hypothetical protein